MKTIEEAAREFAKKQAILEHTFTDEVAKRVAEHACYKAALQMAEFMQRWIPVEEELPIAYETGGWDGKRSDLVLVKYADGDWTKARLYSGELDGHKFNDWYDENDYLINTITHFRPIELKP